MILTASMRTDIPRYYSEWFFNRLKAGFVDVLNSYSREDKTYLRYQLNSDVVDAIQFCSKYYEPMLAFSKFYSMLGCYHVYLVIL